jgi:hypothetical protein
MSQSNPMFVLSKFISIFYQYGFVSNFEVSPLPIDQILITFYFLFVEILSVCLTYSHCDSVVVWFSKTESNSWRPSTNIFDSSIILNKFCSERIPITWYAIIYMRIKLKYRLSWFSMLTTYCPSITSSFRNGELRYSKINYIFDF